MCWKERTAGRLDSALLDIDVLADAEVEEGFDIPANRTLHVRPDLDWQHLESAFDATVSHAPSPSPYFTILYYLFPWNVINFLRSPVAYLTNASLQTPYTVSWEEALDVGEIRSKSEVTAYVSYLSHSSQLVSRPSSEVTSAIP
jgi:hypothetical protein